VDKDDDTKEQFFLDLQEHLLSEPVQDEILGHGRRTGLVGMNPADAPRDVFRPEWGIDLTRSINPIVFPKAPVIREALDLYQVAFRKPSFTIFALDFSGSMEGGGAAELKRAMRTLLDKDEAAKYLLQPSDKDVTIVLPFNHELLGEWRVDGNAEADLDALLAQIERQVADGGTDIYLPVMRGLEIIKREGLERAFPAIILLSDGVSNNGSFAELSAFWRNMNMTEDVPVFAILFGQASEEQLAEITEFSSGRIFDGQKDLVKAFRKAKGYN
jgi:Ca-activated chloride channel family protein